MSNLPLPADLKFAMLVLVDEHATPLPLEHTVVNAHLSGLIATVTVQQSYVNPKDQAIELEYLFPLPENAAIIDFSIHIGTRQVRAELRESNQAREAFEQARQAGQHSALLEQRRPNLFSVRLANVLPGEHIATALQYEDHLVLSPGELEFIFPMGITPRYHDPAHPDEMSGANPPLAGASEKIGPVELQVTADLGTETGAPFSPSHALVSEALGKGQFTLHFAEETLPDHDFVLCIPLSSKPFEVTAWCARDAAGEVFLANWLPGLPQSAEVPAAAPVPREFIFVLDRSGSMHGEPIRQARNALRACLRILEPQDFFRILLFDEYLEWDQPGFTQVSQAAIEEADTFLNQVEGRGGTEILQALDAALNLPASPERTRYVVFLTDGAVSAEERALTFVRQKVNHARIFTFGIGPSVNRALLARLAQFGRGAAEFLQLDEDIEGAILRFQDKVAFPVLTDIHLEWAGCLTWDIYPALLPDLYAGQPLQLVGKLKREPGSSPTLRFSGRRGEESIEMEIPLPDGDEDAPEIRRAWARGRVDDLLEQSAVQARPAHQVRQEIISLALEHHLVTPFTAFVAVDQDVINSGGKLLTLAVAQPLPRGLDRGGFLASPAAAPASPKSFPRMILSEATQYDTGALPPAAAKPSDFDSMHGGPPFTLGFKGSTADLPEYIIEPANNEEKPGGLIDRLASPAADKLPPDKPNAILRWLARIQKLDGSWPQGLEFTAAALLNYVRSGQTLLRGHYRKQVRRAADWLTRASGAGDAAYTQVLALFELAQTDGDVSLQTAAQTILNKLPVPSNAFQQTVFARYHPGANAPLPPQQIKQKEDLRIAAALHLHLEVPQDLITSDPSGLALVWSQLVVD